MTTQRYTATSAALGRCTATRAPFARVLCFAIAGAATHAVAQTAPSDGAVRLAPVVVTATRTEESPFNVPASIETTASRFTGKPTLVF